MITVDQFKQALLQLGSYRAIRQEYWGAIFRSVQDYLNAPANVAVTKFRNEAKRACRVAFLEASQQGFEDGGGTLPYSRSFAAQINSMLATEQSYIDGMFVQLRELKKSGEEYNAAQEAQARADGYARGLDHVYNMSKVEGAGNKMLTLGGEDGKESCSTCSSLKGKRHKAKWWQSKGLVPGVGNRNYECGGFQCQHYLYDDQGYLFTI